MFRYIPFVLSLACSGEVTYDIEPCLAAEEEAQCLSAEDALEDLQQQNADCSLEDVVYEGFIDGLCCYDLVAYGCS